MHKYDILDIFMRLTSHAIYGIMLLIISVCFYIEIKKGDYEDDKKEIIY